MLIKANLFSKSPNSTIYCSIFVFKCVKGKSLDSNRMSLRIAVCYLLYIMMHVINLQKVDIELQSCILCIKLINLVRWQILSSIYYTPSQCDQILHNKMCKNLFHISILLPISIYLDIGMA